MNIPNATLDRAATYYQKHELRFIFAIATIYLMGALGIAFPRSQVLDQIPWVLWLTTFFLFFTHPIKSSLFIFKFLLVLLSGWAIEVMGVQGGILFGKYGYGNLFGKTIIDVPIACGAIWLANTFIMLQVSRYVFKVTGFWKTVLTAALLMTLLDAFVQLPAFKIGFWSYAQLAYPPFYHPMAYFGISLLTCTAAGEDFVSVRNAGAIALAWIQPLFLLALYILVMLFR